MLPFKAFEMTGNCCTMPAGGNKGGVSSHLCTSRQAEASLQFGRTSLNSMVVLGATSRASPRTARTLDRNSESRAATGEIAANTADAGNTNTVASGTEVFAV